MLPTVDFCGLPVTRLVIGANLLGGFSHQNPERDAEMVAYYTPEPTRETWRRAEAAGINTMVTNNATPHVMQSVRGYLAEGGPLQWIAQLTDRPYDSMIAAIDEAVRIGAKAAYFHGGLVDGFYAGGDDRALRIGVGHARSVGLPIGVIGRCAASRTSWPRRPARTCCRGASRLRRSTEASVRQRPLPRCCCSRTAG